MPSSQELGTSRPPQSRKQSPMLWILKRSPKNSWRIPGWTSTTTLQNGSIGELRSSERTASLPEVRLADSVLLSCIHSPQHAKRTASGSGNGSKIFFCASRQLWPDRLVLCFPGEKQSSQWAHVQYYEEENAVWHSNARRHPFVISPSRFSSCIYTRPWGWLGAYIVKGIAEAI